MPYIVSVVLMVVGQVFLAVYGHNLIHSYEKWMSYVLGALFLVATVLTFAKLSSLHKHTIVTGGFHPAMFVLLVGAVVGYAFGWTPYGADYTRYLPATISERRVFNLTFLGGFVSAVWIEALGALIAAMGLTSSPNPVTQLVTVMGFFTVPMLIAIILGTGTSNALNIYSGALSALVLNIPLKRWVSAIVIGVLWHRGVAAARGPTRSSWSRNFTNYLLLLAYWIAPWLAIVISDFYLFHGAATSLPSYTATMACAGAGLIAYVVGILVSIPFWSQTNFTGFIAAKLQGADITYYVGFLVAGAIYLVLARPRAATAASPSRSVQGSQAR